MAPTNQPSDECLAARAGDRRIDLTRGVANWFIFLDHIPHNAVNLLTMRNFGFSRATDLFVFVAGYAAALYYGRMARERGLVVATTRILRRLWQLYAAYVVLFVIYIDVISNVAAQYAATEIIDEYNVTGLVDYPTQTLMHGLLLQAKPLNLDTLQLFVALMAFFPLVLWKSFGNVPSTNAKLSFAYSSPMRVNDAPSMENFCTPRYDSSTRENFFSFSFFANSRNAVWTSIGVSSIVHLGDQRPRQTEVGQHLGRAQTLVP